MVLHTTTSMRLMCTSLMLCLAIATTALADSKNNPVLDTKGHSLKPGKDYFIKPAITDNGGRVTLINRNMSCPLYIGQENTDSEKGTPVFITPFAKEDDVVKVNRDFKVAFSAATLCLQGTEWKLGENDAKSGRRLIVASGNGSYFRIVETQFKGIYNIRWCPSDVCRFCKLKCGDVGGLRENGKILLALDGNALPVVFQKAA